MVQQNINSSLLAKYKNHIISFFIIGYIFITLLPFYFLFVRSFVSTQDSTELHFSIPKPKELKMSMKYGIMLSYFSIDPDDFKNQMGIDSYIDSNLTLEEISKDYKIPEAKILIYLRPYYVFSGWFAILKNEIFLHSIWGTLFVSAATISIGGFFGICTGYVLAGFRKKWHMYVYNYYLLQMIIPGVIVMIPIYIIITQYLHLVNSYWALILPGIQGGAVSTMIFTAYTSTIPYEIWESVAIDGGSRFKYFFSVLLPLVKTPFATFAAITLPWIWNDLLGGLLYLKPEKQTLIPLINTFTGGKFTTNFQALYAGLFISVLPLLVVYLFLQKLFIRSVMAGALKG